MASASWGVSRSRARVSVSRRMRDQCGCVRARLPSRCPRPCPTVCRAWWFSGMDARGVSARGRSAWCTRQERLVHEGAPFDARSRRSRRSSSRPGPGAPVLTSPFGGLRNCAAKRIPGARVPVVRERRSLVLGWRNQTYGPRVPAFGDAQDATCARDEPRICARAGLLSVACSAPSAIGADRWLAFNPRREALCSAAILWMRGRAGRCHCGDGKSSRSASADWSRRLANAPRRLLLYLMSPGSASE